jgi:hypothetical protein
MAVIYSGLFKWNLTRNTIVIYRECENLKFSDKVDVVYSHFLNQNITKAEYDLLVKMWALEEGLSNAK